MASGLICMKTSKSIKLFIKFSHCQVRYKGEYYKGKK